MSRSYVTFGAVCYMPVVTPVEWFSSGVREGGQHLKEAVYLKYINSIPAWQAQGIIKTKLLIWSHRSILCRHLWVLHSIFGAVIFPLDASAQRSKEPWCENGKAVERLDTAASGSHLSIYYRKIRTEVALARSRPMFRPTLTKGRKVNWPYGS